MAGKSAAGSIQTCVGLGEKLCGFAYVWEILSGEYANLCGSRRKAVWVRLCLVNTLQQEPCDFAHSGSYFSRSHVASHTARSVPSHTSGN
jgi:hypothetical protein